VTDRTASGAVWIGTEERSRAAFTQSLVDGGKTGPTPLPLSGQSQFGLWAATSSALEERLLLGLARTLRTGKDRIYSWLLRTGGDMTTRPRLLTMSRRIHSFPPVPPLLSLRLMARRSSRGRRRARRDDVFVARSTDSGRTWES
jgi:hypothetical protein